MPESDKGSAPTNRAAAATVGGARTQVARRTAASRGTVAPSSGGARKGGGGILNFYTDESAGLKVGPTTVLVMSLVFMAIVCCLHITGKIASSGSSSGQA
mmetsp:Transcript_98136/g.184554  ORF Transcript_98136/g.184554 Transcript_98136/m.184554 type:complete len:100 (-) Transcript_98136:207-506(-)